MEGIICIFTVINSGVKVNGKEYLNNSLESVSLTNNELEIEFPELLNFLDVDKNLQSCDPSVYNFQMFARRNGLYFYFVQYLDVVINDYLDSWEKTNVVMEFIHMYPQYASMFPKTRKNNVYSMQRRIVRALDYKLNYIKNKVNRLIKRYKNEMAQGKLRYRDEDI